MIVADAFNALELNLVQAVGIHDDLYENGIRLNAYPNPFNLSTTICYNLPKASHVLLTIYNLMGQTTDILVDEYQSLGMQNIEWSPHNASTGLYFCQLKVGNQTKTLKLVIQK